MIGGSQIPPVSAEEIEAGRIQAKHKLEYALRMRQEAGEEALAGDELALFKMRAGELLEAEARRDLEAVDAVTAHRHRNA